MKLLQCQISLDGVKPPAVKGSEYVAECCCLLEPLFVSLAFLFFPLGTFLGLPLLAITIVYNRVLFENSENVVIRGV